MSRGQKSPNEILKTLCHCYCRRLQTYCRKEQQTYSSSRSLFISTNNKVLYKKLHWELLDSFLLLSAIDFSQAASLTSIKNTHWLLVESVSCKRFPMTTKTTQNGGLVNSLLVGVHQIWMREAHRQLCQSCGRRLEAGRGGLSNTRQYTQPGRTGRD